MAPKCRNCGLMQGESTKHSNPVKIGRRGKSKGLCVGCDQKERSQQQFAATPTPCILCGSTHSKTMKALHIYKSGKHQGWCSKCVQKDKYKYKACVKCGMSPRDRPGLALSRASGYKNWCKDCAKDDRVAKVGVNWVPDSSSNARALEHYLTRRRERLARPLVLFEKERHRRAVVEAIKARKRDGSFERRD